MASFAHLSREERIGLGIAAAAHVALVAALVLQVRDEPTALPIPERMSVSLADEVSLTSTAPDPSAEPQAAVAPVLSDVPEPVVEPEVRRELRPSPRQTVSPRPSPRQTQRPTPRPTQTSQGGANDFEKAFNQGTPNPRATGNSNAQPAVTFGAAEQASLEQAINRQLRAPWQRNAPQGVDADKLVTVLSWELNPDGSLKGAPRVVSQSGITDSNRPQAALHAERAIRAVQVAAPFELPEQFYDKWKRIRSWRFDWRLSS
jgi:periplasmic protein TonB